MIKKLILMLCVVAGLNVQARDYYIDFSGSGGSSQVEMVSVINLSDGVKITLPGSGILHLKKTTTGFPVWPMTGNMRIYPNPSAHYSYVEFDNVFPGNMTMEVFDLSGRKIGGKQCQIPVGRQSFRIEGLMQGIYTVRLQSVGYSFSEKLISLQRYGSNLKIEYQGSVDLSIGEPAPKAASTITTMEFNEGDILLFEASSGNFKTIVTDSPVQSKTIHFPFVECVDADGNHYPIVKIGSKYWMAENLKTTKYGNDDPIPMIAGNNEWIATTSGAFCNYGNLETNGQEYGRLYNWRAITDSRGIAPEGWRVPGYAESVAMAQSLVGKKAVGGLLKETGTSYWNPPNTGASNATGFSARAGGIRFDDGIFYNKGNFGYWWCPSANDSIHSYAFGLRHISDSLKFYLGIKNYGLSLRCVKDIQPPVNLPNFQIKPAVEVSSLVIPATGGVLQIQGGNNPLSGFIINVPENSFPESKKFTVSYMEIVSHDFGKFINPLTPLITIAYGGGYADSILTVKVPVTIPEGHFAMGFHYNELTGELDGIPVLSSDNHSVTVVSRHFDLASVTSDDPNLKSVNLTGDVTRKGYFFISSIAKQELMQQDEIVSGFEPGHDDWEFPNYGSVVSFKGICAGMSLSAMWYYTNERSKGNSPLFHKYDKFTIANFNRLWQDNTVGLKVSSMAQYDYKTNRTLYEKAVDKLAEDKTRDSLSWYAFAYSMLQTRQPQFIGIMSSTGGGHVLIANEVWMQYGKLWIADPNHPGNRDLFVYYRSKEFEPYFASLEVTEAAKNFEYIAYYGKTAIIDWKLLGQRWSEVEDGTIGAGVMPDVKLKVSDPSGKTGGWLLEDNYKTKEPSVKLSIQNNPFGNLAFSFFDEEGFPLYSENPDVNEMYYGIELSLNPGLNIFGYCVYGLTNYYDYSAGKYSTSWDWADFKWIDIYRTHLEISPSPINAEQGKEVEIKALTYRTAPIDVKYVWNFGDGSPEVIVYNDSIVKHIFKSAGTFDVTVTQYNNLNGAETGKASAKAYIGNGYFYFQLKASLWTRCVTGEYENTQGTQTTYDLVFKKDRFKTSQTYVRSGNTITASWDGIYIRWPDMAEFKRKGTATFVISEDNSSLQFTIVEEMPDLSTGISLYTWNSTVSGEIPLIQRNAGIDYFGINDANIADAKINVRVKRTFQNGTVCEATGFTDNTKVFFIINLYPPTP
jgi:uncharacterized protein (TIGR02145 family)